MEFISAVLLSMTLERCVQKARDEQVHRLQRPNIGERLKHDGKANGRENGSAENTRPESAERFFAAARVGMVACARCGRFLDMSVSLAV